MSSAKWIKYVFVAIALILLQVLVVDQIEISRFLHPQIYFMVLLGLPVNMKHWYTYLVAFALGLSVDAFVNTPGLNAFVCTLMAFFRYVYLANFTDKDWLSSNVQPSLGNSDTLNYLVALVVFALFFHLFYFLIEQLSFRRFDEILLKTLYSTSLSILLILLLQFVFSPRVKNE